MPRFGICTKVEEGSSVKAAGWDYVEESVQGLLKGLEDEVVWDGQQRAKSGALPVEAANMLVPAALKVTGPSVVIEGLRAYMSRVTERAQRLGLNVEVHQVPWGEGAPADQITERLKADKNHEIKGVLVVHNETATGVTSDIAAVRKAIDAANHPALLYVDGVSSIASLPFDMDGWGVDAARMQARLNLVRTWEFPDVPQGGSIWVFALD